MCKKQFSLKRNLNAHMKLHDEARYKFNCNVPGCTKNYFKRCNLKQHYAEKHREVSTASVEEWLQNPKTKRITIKKTSHQCHKCQKYFSKNSNLNAHLRTHDEKKPEKLKCNKKVLLSFILSEFYWNWNDFRLTSWFGSPAAGSAQSVDQQTSCFSFLYVNGELSLLYFSN